MSDYNNMEPAVAGLKSGIDSRIESWRAAQAMSFGVPVFGYEGDANSGYNFVLDTSTTLFDADFVTSNNIVATVNGVAVTAVVFSVDQATTIAAVAAQIEADITGAVATVTGVRTIAVLIKGTTVVITWVITLGASQAGDTVTVTSAQVFAGVAMLTQKESASRSDLEGTELEAAINYVAKDAMNVLTLGYIWVNASKAVNANDAAYIVDSGADIGKFTDDTNEYDCKCRFRSTTTAAGLVLVEVRGQN